MAAATNRCKYEFKSHFSISISSEKTPRAQTPCRNAEIRDAVSFVACSVMSFARRICLCLQRQYEKIRCRFVLRLRGHRCRGYLCSRRSTGVQSNPRRERLIVGNEDLKHAFGNEDESDSTTSSCYCNYESNQSDANQKAPTTKDYDSIKRNGTANFQTMVSMPLTAVDSWTLSRMSLTLSFTDTNEFLEEQG